MEQKTLLEAFYEKEQGAMANEVYLRQPFGDTWREYTWKEVGQMARKLATGLKAMGLKPKSHIALVSKNCSEWIIADLAIMLGGYISVPLYATLTGEQISTVLKLGDVDAIIMGKLDAGIWEDMKNGIPKDMPMITFPHYEGGSKVDRGEPWDDFLNRHEPMKGNPVPNLDDLWTIVFTSGTTGTPKGVMLNYRILDEAGKTIEVANPLKIDIEGGENHYLSFLPLNHIAERVIVEAGSISHGKTVSFVERLDTFGKNMASVQTTVLLAVTRIWTKLQMGILAKMPQKRLDMLLKIPVIKNVIKKKIKAGLGFSRCRSFVSGAAPISANAKEWFAKLDIPISEGYGMTENCAICTFLLGDEKRTGSVGRPQPGVELRIDPETEEVQMRAPYNMVGYYKAPEKTAEVLKDGWLHTGDQGRIDEEGYLHLTGRVKDTFKTAKGKYIVPSPIEFEFADNNDIEQICLVGLGCPQPMALVYPSELGATKSAAELKESLASTLGAVNAAKPNYRRVSTIVVTKEPWTVDNGLLTPTLKVKRGKIDQRFKEQYMQWHEAKDNVVWEA